MQNRFTFTYLLFLLSGSLQVTSAGVMSTVAGTGAGSDGGDGVSATAASLQSPRGVALHPFTGDLLIADTNNNRIRLVRTFVFLVEWLSAS